ncbi:MAG: hypothetical protein GX565_07430 [Lentisphaerae bacterium]|nr:hypothetical protein [Lentisphaerota bacterium]
MNGDFGFKLEGVDELILKLKAVSRETANKGGRAALRKAAKIILDAAKDGAQRLDDPATAEDIEKNLVIRWNRKAFKRGDLALRVGVLGGAGGNKKSEEFAGLPGKDTRHWRYLEFGTEKIPARPFMRPALSNNVMKASDAFIQEYDKRLARAIKRGA